MSQMHSRQALISVSDKSGLLPLARGLVRHGVRILSTGGTSRILHGDGIDVVEVSAYTGFPEMLDGRVKTLHPRIHAGLLAKRDTPDHVAEMAREEIGYIDFVIVNLYPFQQTVAKPDCSLEEAIENIDIGGPAMLRAAAKNHAHVTVLSDPADYPALIEELDSSAGNIGARTRLTLARKAFAHTARYDAAISDYLGGILGDRSPSEFPDRLNLRLLKRQELRYGENPHQRAALYTDQYPARGQVGGYRQLQGKELSFNNIVDADTAWACAQSFTRPACVIVKHANPCGVAQEDRLAIAYRNAYATDPTSAFGGIIAFNREVDGETARAIISNQFVEVIASPSFHPEAREVLSAKGGIRLLEIPGIPEQNILDMKRVGGGLLVQTADRMDTEASDLRRVTQKAPSQAQLEDLLFAWRVAKFVKSNAIVFASDNRTLAIGAGQMSRIDSVRIAAMKAREAGLDLAGCVAASDAFFPFRDGLDAIAHAGAVAVIQPGGSVRDSEVIAAANEHGLGMVLTGTRHFRH